MSSYHTPGVNPKLKLTYIVRDSIRNSSDSVRELEE